MLAIGGVGGLAVGLAGREILENLFTGLIILSSSPFEVGDEVMFSPSTGPVSHAPNLVFLRCQVHKMQQLYLLHRSPCQSCEWSTECVVPQQETFLCPKAW